MKNINSKLKIALVVIAILILLLSILLAFLFVTKDERAQDFNNNQQNNENPVIPEIEEEEKEEIIDIPSLEGKDAFEILDVLIAKYGEPETTISYQQGLVEVLKEMRDQENPTFETVTWVDIKYGYNFTFNFWTDASLGREDSYYITGHKNKGNSLEEIFGLLNVPRDSNDFVIEITDLGGAVFNVGITPKSVAQTEPPEILEELEELAREEVLEILQINAEKKWRSDPARANLEYDNQVQAYEWVIKQTKYLDLMNKAKREWKHDYVMVKWKYDKLVEAHEATL